MSLLDLLGGGAGLFVTIGVVVVLIWVLFKLDILSGIGDLLKLPFIALWWIIKLPFRAIGWFFSQITGIGKSAVGLADDLARFSQRSHALTIGGIKRKMEEKAAADAIAGSTEQQKDLVNDITSTIGDASAEAEQKYQALEAFYDNIEKGAEEQKSNIDSLSSKLKQDIRESKKVISNVKILIRRSDYLFKQVGKGIKGIEEMGGDAQSGKSLLAKIENEGRIRAFEGKEREDLDRVKEIVKVQSSTIDSILDTIKTCKKASEPGVLDLPTIQLLTANLQKLHGLEDTLKSYSQALSSMESKLIEEEQQISAAETKGEEIVNSLNKQIAAHSAQIAELKAKVLADHAQDKMAA